MEKKSYFYEVLLLVGTAVWGASFFLVKGLLQSVNPFVLVTYRFLISAGIIACVVVFQKKSLFSNLKEGLFLGLILWICIILQCVGMIYTTAANSGFITGMFIVFIPIFSYFFFKGKFIFSGIIAILIDIIGLWFLTGGINEINRGDILTLIGAAVGGLHVLLVDKYRKRDLDVYVLCLQQFLVVGLLSLLVSIIFDYSFVLVSTDVIWKMSLLILFPTVFSFLVQLISQKHLSAIKASLIFTFEPFFAAGFAWTLGGEQFILNRAFGGFLIFLGMIVYELPINIWFNKISGAKKNS